MNNEKLMEIASLFAFEGVVESVEQLGEGFINDTYVVSCGVGAPL